MASSSFLTPPTRYALRDAVIGGVVQRVDPVRSRLGLTDDNDNRVVQSYTKARQTFSTDSYSSNVLLSVTEPYQPRAVIGQRRPPELDSFADLTTRRSAKTTQGTAEQQQPQQPPQSVGERKIKVSASRRERCRINQARYRKRQRKYADDLDESIRQVQEEIQDLETQRQTISRRAPTNETVWVVATEYFRLFRYGYMTPTVAPESSATSSLVGNAKTFQRPHQSHAQLDFLKSTMASDVTDGNVCGVEALLENWKLLSLYCGDVQVQVKRMEQTAPDCLLASTMANVTLTKSTLCNVFPHLVEDGASKLSPLAEKLLDQRLVLRGSVRFVWDASAGRVVRVESKVDLMTPMLRLLGNLKDVAAAFDKALVTLEGSFIRKEMSVDGRN